MPNKKAKTRKRNRINLNKALRLMGRTSNQVKRIAKKRKESSNEVK